MGEGEAFLPNGQRVSGAQAMQAASITPVLLEAKEGLALNNGTQFMTAVGGLALLDAECLARAGTLACALSLEAIKGVPAAFEARIHALRPHPGQIAVAEAILQQIENSEILSRKSTQPGFTMRMFLDEAEKILKSEGNERCQTEAARIRSLRNGLAELMHSNGEATDAEFVETVGDEEEFEQETRRRAAAEVLAAQVTSAYGIYALLSGSLPRSALGAREYFRLALDEMQKAVPSFVPVQDDYSFRCTPQVIGPALDTFAHVRQVLRRELNSATDNPLIFPPRDGEHADDVVRRLAP